MPPGLRHAVHDVRASRRPGDAVFVVGGAVRDLLLGRRIRDLDLVVEGDALPLAERLARKLGASLRTHERFGTATLTLSGGETLDIASARVEAYPRPGALPLVTIGATLTEDLARRDFAIHAMAVPLTRPIRVVDPFGGRADLERRYLRILHPQSFRDDPTRILRAVRYAARLGFRLAPATRKLLAAALAEGALDRISPDRLRRELRLILEEPDRVRAVGMLRRLRVDAAVDPILTRRGVPGRFRDAGTNAGWLCYLRAWMGRANDREIDGLAARLGLSRAERRVLSSPRRTPRVPIRGADLIAAGIAPGPVVGRALAKTRAALDRGRIAPEDALVFAVRAARGEER